MIYRMTISAFQHEEHESRMKSLINDFLNKGEEFDQVVHG
jgi:hypothetical protein